MTTDDVRPRPDSNAFTCAQSDFLVEHRLTLRAICPQDGTEDVYNAIVSADRVIPVEEIQATARRIAGRPLYQEELTRELARQIGVEVVTHGIHSGVYTTCRCHG